MSRQLTLFTRQVPVVNLEAEDRARALRRLLWPLRFCGKCFAKKNNQIPLFQESP